MSRKRPPENLSALSDPVKVHSDQVDKGGLDLASLVHSTSKVVCDRLGVPCGCQANLPEGLCIATNERCPHAPGDGSAKPYASEAAAKK
jgi:hypothetical protein